MTDPSGSSCIGIKVFLQAHLVLEESIACTINKIMVSNNWTVPSSLLESGVLVGHAEVG
jgi:hypothetical protein